MFGAEAIAGSVSVCDERINALETPLRACCPYGDFMRPALLAIFLSAVLAGCSKAAVATVDPKNDVHCSVLAFYFHGLAKHTQSPEKQIQATKGLHDWYAIKMSEVAGERFKDPSIFEKEVGPILESVKADPLAMRGKMAACT